jgi:hypothetical protein
MLDSLEDRWALAAGVEFLDGAASGSWGISGLRAWFHQHLVEPGHMVAPGSVHEPPAGVLTVWSRGASSPPTTVNPATLLAKTRSNVLAALRGFLGVPADDRFVKAALFSGRVQRSTVPPPSSGSAPRSMSSASWVPRPDPTAPLSALVLSLFAVDALTHRERWERNLSICDVCGRVGFVESPDRRRTCHAHAPRPSGTLRITPPDAVKTTGRVC